MLLAIDIGNTNIVFGIYKNEEWVNRRMEIVHKREQTEDENNDGFEINIINPRAIIVAGTTKELNTKTKRNHFKNLRESLKDIEFVLYDELLERLKNLLETVKLE